MVFAQEEMIFGVNSRTMPVETCMSTKHSLLAAVMDAIKPVFKKLVSVDFLKRCIYGTTPNPNEGVNSVIWTRITKKA